MTYSVFESVKLSPENFRFDTFVTHILKNFKNLEENNDIVRNIFSCSSHSIIKYFIENNLSKSKNLINMKIKNGYANYNRPIHYVARRKMEDLIIYLLENGANAKIRDEYNLYPMHYICEFSSPSLLKYSLDKIGTLDEKDSITFFGRRPSYNLHFYNKNPELSKLFQENGIISTDSLQIIKEKLGW